MSNSYTYARVIVDIKHSQVNSYFDYIIPPALKDLILVGMRVYVPFGNQNRLGYVIKIISESSLATREIIEVLDEKSVITDEQLKIANHMISHPGNLESGVFETIVSSTLFFKYEKIVELLDLNKIDNDEIIVKFKKGNKWKINKKDYKKFYNILKRLEKNNALIINTKIKPRSKAKQQFIVRANTNYNHHLTDRQADLFDLVKTRGEILLSELKDYVSMSVVNTLIKYDVLIKEIIDISRLNTNYINSKSNELVLTEELKEVSTDINNSNKSEIVITSNSYSDRIKLIVQEIKDNIKNNKQTLVLVPETLLIVPIINEITKYFNKINILPYHSELSSGVLYDAYDALVNDSTINLIIGTRNAVFLPIPNLSSVIIYDSHNKNYISQFGTYFDTLEIAVIKKEYYKAKLIYISYIKPLRLVFREKKFRQSILPVDLKPDYGLASISLVDMREEIKRSNYSIFSKELKDNIEEALENKKQVMLLMNLKGYASFVMCRNCGHIERDSLNDLPMIYYKEENKLKARHTNEEKPFSRTCDICKTEMLRPVSAGVEQLNMMTRKEFPDARVLYLNQQNIKNNEQYLNKIEQFSSGAYDIIIGTTFINKSYNARNISVIGVLMIDQILHLPYYDAYENSYHYLKQTLQHDFNEKVKVVIQTYNPKNKVLNWFRDYEDDNYYQDQLQTRKFAKLPPYNKMVQLVFKGDSYFTTYQKAFAFKKEIEGSKIEILGPLPSYLLKDKNLYRFIITLKYDNWDNRLDEIFRRYQKEIIIEVNNTNNLV